MRGVRNRSDISDKRTKKYGPSQLTQSRKGAWTCILRLLALLAITTTPAIARSTIQFAGFAYGGSFQDIPGTYPYTFAINTKNNQGVSVLDQALDQRLDGVHFDGFRLNDTSLARIHSNHPIALAFVLTRENVSTEHIDSAYKVVVILSAEALFFNEKTKEVTADYPIGFQYVDVFPKMPTQSALRKLVQALYVGHMRTNIMREFVKRLHNVRLRSYYGNTIRVTAVHISPLARMVIPTAQKAHVGALKSFIADQFSADLSVRNQVPVLPYMAGEAIGNVIALRFANGETFNLVLPKPDYDVVLTLAGFKKIPYQRGSWGTSWLYGAFVHVAVFEPLSGQKYMDSMVKQAAIKIIPVSQTNVSSWPAFEETLSNLLDQVSLAIARPTHHWARAHMGRGRDYRQLVAVKKVVHLCQ